jgi:hypothetical protein
MNREAVEFKEFYMKKYSFLLLVIFQSCAQFPMPIPDMDMGMARNVEVDLFKPNRDFPVVVGDQDMEWDRPVERPQSRETYRRISGRIGQLPSITESPEDYQGQKEKRLPNYFRAPAAARVGMGMSKDEVLDQLGRPRKVEVAGNPANENERWGYLANGAMKYIYFESGYVEGWE